MTAGRVDLEPLRTSRLLRTAASVLECTGVDADKVVAGELRARAILLELATQRPLAPEAEVILRQIKEIRS